VLGIILSQGRSDFVVDDDKVMIVTPGEDKVNGNARLDAIVDDEEEFDNLAEDKDLSSEIDQGYGPRNSTYILGTKQPQDYPPLFTTISHNRCYSGFK
jgi:hypothetical protein